MTRGITIKPLDYKCFSLLKFPKHYTGVAFINEIHAVEYYYKGVCHRLDGPANIPVYYDNVSHTFYIAPEELCRYYIHGVSVPRQNYWNHPLVIEHKVDRILES